MQPPSPAQIARLYQQGVDRQAAGDLDGAEALLKQVLAARPRQPEALFQLGRIAMARGAPKRAVQQFEKAAQAKPGEPAIWLAWAEALAALGDKARLRGFAAKTRAARLPPDVQARIQAVLARGTRPGIPGPGVLGSAPPAEIDALLALVNSGRLDAAEPRAAALRARHADSAVLADIHGTVLNRLGRPDAARAAFAEALRLAPELVEAALHLGEAHLAARDYAAAADAFSRAIALGQTRPQTFEALARALERAGRPEDALAAHDRAVAAAPDRPEVHGRRAILLQQMGRFQEAEAGFRRSIDLDPTNGEPFRLLVKGRRIGADDPLVAEMAALWDRPDLSDHSRMNLGFALAKAMEDAGQPDRIFAYLHPANALMRKLYPYDIAERRAEIDALKAAVADTDFTARRVAGVTDYAPIFVTGMPRSGTTLVEQILASHSRVTGGGELGFVAGEAMRLMSDGAGGLRPLSGLGDREIAEFGHAVEAHLRMRLPGSDIVTDKSIQTYMVAGLVRLALPNARIVVVHRDPRDTCLSIYKNIFAEGTHRYAYDLRDLGLYYRMFVEVIDFWRARLPDGFHEIRYENLIADPEPQARALVAAGGLAWEDGCLDFHKTERRVATLSLHQVRQPIYATSMKAWERHADELAPLIEALGDAID
ncbi:tetratricopeptide repeat-containing sulfotransferase family protein [Rhodovulum euryhalinum]|uniref:Flp pilus assembly protein TadD n=1 Tax=Rhodovulum euryhalinum TaxID=35805 RepID=A0A4R2KGN5_9RHOB|nr:tetratricopeptide repeat-containing sulfotransferase family protein [Rhodovulum euryhalinum]TCO69599.1 Flp pilus assembly protein TadD [Rhodovulum euryhalinum]